MLLGNLPFSPVSQTERPLPSWAFPPFLGLSPAVWSIPVVISDSRREVTEEQGGSGRQTVPWVRCLAAFLSVPRAWKPEALVP